MNEDSFDSGVEKLVEDLAAQVIIADPGDIPAMGALLKLFDFLEKTEFPYVKELSLCLKEYVEKLILEEETDMSPLEESVEIFHIILTEYKKDNGPDHDKLKQTLKNIKCDIQIDQTAEDVPGASPEKEEPAAEDIQLYIEFAGESLENLENAEVDLISLEDAPGDKTLINSVFRAFHTIKGVSGFLDLPVINSLAHKTETLLDNIRQGYTAPESEITDVILDSIDIMKKMLVEIQSSINSNNTLPDTVWNIDTFLGTLEKILNPPEDQPIGEMLVSNQSASPEDIESSLDEQKKHPEKKIGEILVEKNQASEKDVAKALRKQKNTRKNNYSVKVDTEKLDSLVDLTGELVIAQSILKELAKNYEDSDNMLVQSLGQMNQIVSSVQKISMSMRMVPIGTTFQKMIRVVRDVSSNLGKKVELSMEGKDTEVDRNMVDALYEPLVHMVRNSVDHGIETPLERTEKGKSEQGHITLSSYHKAGNIVIEIIDDGKGLNKENLLAKARQKGIISENEKLSENEIFNLIFHPGFSTTENVTDVSGRGVGMDVVKEAINKLKGRLDITSEPDKGTRFTIRLPLTMAIIDGMLIRVGNEKYIVPTMSILEAFPFAESSYFTVEQKGEMIKARGEIVPLIRLDKVCNTQYDDANKNLLVLIVENKGARCGLLLDELLGKDEFVIKNLGTLFKNTKVFSGGAILGDGTVGLIIDMSGLFEWAEI